MSSPEIPTGGDAITAEWLRRALIAGGASDAAAIEEVIVEDIGAGVGLLGEILRCRLVCRHTVASIPATVIVKLPSQESKSRRMSRLQSLYQREYDYYRHVAPHAPIRSPRLLYGKYEDRGDRFVLVLEDLGHLQTGDQLGGATPAQARSAVRAIARLHGHYWDKVGRPPLSGFYDIGTPGRRAVIQGVYLAFLGPTLNHFGSLFSAEMRRLAEAYGPRVADHIADVGAAPQTFGHGDFRLDNMFFGAGDEDEVAVLDWQVSGQLATACTTSRTSWGAACRWRCAAISNAIWWAEYTDIVCSMGAKRFTFDDCWRLYRQNMLGRLLVTIFVCGGLDLNDERSRRLAEIGVRRALAAIEDLDAGEFLPARRPLVSISNVFTSLSRLAYRGYRVVR